MPSLRSAVVILVCSTLLLLQTFGVHVHALPDHAAQHHLASIDGQEHEHHVVISEHDVHHAAAHLEDGAADVEQAKVPGKTSSGLILLALLGTALIFGFLPMLRSTAIAPLCPVPARRRGGYILPPSQAPPLAS